jgi:hypothetical protein
MSDLLNSASLVVIPSGYKEDTVYSVVPSDGSGDLSFTRASNGTRVNSAGLVEDCPWNLLSYSEQFDNAFWIKATNGSATFVVTANQTTAPNGTNTADLVSITRSATSELAAIYTNVGQGVGTFKNTIWLKAKDSSNVGKTIDLWSWEGDTRGYTKITLTADWVRYEQNTTVFTGTAAELFDFGLLPISFSTSTTLAVEFYAWGGQSNIGSTAKPYFPTTDRLNVPRLTYQNGGGGCPSLLLEKQSTNLAVQSNAFNTTPWVSNEFNGTTPVITANYGISPDGTQNASRIILERTNSSASYSQIYQYPITTTIGQQYTWSVWLKSLSGTPTISIIGDFGRPPVILTNEWVRYSGTGTASAVVSQLEIAILGSNFASGNSLTADFLAWGYQFEASSYPTSYIPTTSASATRVADACLKTGISSLIGQTEGSVFFDFTVDTISAQTSDPVLWYMKDGGAGERYVELYSNGNLVYVDAGSVTNATITKTGLTVGRHKCAIAYATNDFVFYVDGVQIGTDTSGTPNGFSTFGLQYYLSIYTGQQKVNQAVLFKTRLTNAELASLTTI